MRRKFVTAVLVLAMIMSMSAIAMAEEPTEPTEPTEPVTAPKDKGNAGIGYKEGTIDIIDPGDPDVPGGNNWNFVTNRNIDFGMHDVVQNVVEQKYASWMEHRGAGTDYVGIIFRNGTLKKANVSVEIGEFQVDTEDGRVSTLKGFELRLVKHDSIIIVDPKEDEVADLTNPYNKTISGPVNAISNSTSTAFSKETDHNEGKISAGSAGAQILNLPGLGVHSASWGGILTVPQNTVVNLGESQAVMTWSINNIPTADPDDDDDI